ncbi:MAG: methyltransferase domain-containing protein [Pseudomonadota bacterium]
MPDDIYDNQHIGFLEELWGKGFLSPGGPEEVGCVLTGIDVAGKHVLDIGSGSGACAALLASDHGAARVIGIDVEDTVCAAATKRVAEEGVADKVEIRRVEPGPFPFEDASFDLVFSKDSIIHIPDKVALAKESFRVLKSGCWFAASDWLISHDGPPSDEMAAYIEQEGLSFAMASPDAYASAMEQSGFVDIELVNRNPWYFEVAANELEWLQGPVRSGLSERHGKDFIDHQIQTWKMMLGVLKSGEHCPHHVRGRKPM